MQKITPILFFDNQAEKAMLFYISIFKDSKIKDIERYPKDELVRARAGSLIWATFELHGQDFTVLNVGPVVKFTDAISFLVSCETQAEVDYLWSELTADGGQEGQCGRLTDRFGVSWQIVPKAVGGLLNDPDPFKAQKAMQAMLQMKKIDIKAMEQARDS